MAARLRINGEPKTALAASDRGLAYGDGLFETIWVHHGDAPLWPRHMARLRHGCERLGLPLPDPEFLWRELVQAALGLDRAVVRITWTRGSGPRGYAPPQAPTPTCIVAASALPQPTPDWYHRGIRVHLCRTRLAVQPLLAGLKHLNRLEQVLARAEWQDQSVGEGLMLDMQDRVTSATAANVFVVRAGALLTPPVTDCGVAGTARAELLAQRPDTRVVAMSLPQLLAADEVFLCSAVRGIVPVCELAGRSWPVGPHTRALQSVWRDAGLPPQVPA